jgi:SAM-dependent methyltransferase
MARPLCPVTGKPAVRRVQSLNTRFLSKLWKAQFGIDPRSSLSGIDAFGLWESPTGLYFFDPMREGDNAFYTSFYAKLLKRKLWSKDCIREEFNIVAKHVKPGERVLDVGCGFAPFKRVLPHANYVGLDPHFADDERVEGVLNETLQDHLKANAGTYDVAGAFQVIEHVTSPTALFADMVKAVKPGGLVCISCPPVPNAFTRIPNFVINAPPHHLTWWTPKSLAALAEACGASVVTVEKVPWADNDAQAFWIDRCSPIHCRKTHYKHAWSWHAALVVAYVLGTLVYKIRGVPKTPPDDDGASLLLIARRNA